MAHSTFLDFDSTRLRLVSFGGKGPPALLLHGLYGRAMEWKGTAAWLGASRDVYAIDQRGHGASSKGCADFSRDAQVDDAVRVIESIDRGAVSLVGQSMGGVTAFLVAARRPELVKELVVIEATAWGGGSGTENWLSRWPLPFRTLDDARRFFASQRLQPDVWVGALERRNDGYWPEFQAEDMAAVAADIQGAYDYRDEWRRIRCPTLLVAGSESWLSHEPMVEMADMISTARYVMIDGAGHDVHLDAPDQLRRSVQAFLAT